MALTHILVGVDFSAGSLAAAVRAAEIAARVGARLTLVHASAPERLDVSAELQATADAYLGVLVERLAGARDQLATLRAELSTGGALVADVVVDRYPDDALVDVANAQGGDLIVTGSRPRSGLRKWLLGSVAESVVRTASCSVLVARPGDADRGFQRVIIGIDFSPSDDVAIARGLALASPGATVDIVHCFHMAFPTQPDQATPIAGPDPTTLQSQLSADAAARGKLTLGRHARADVTLGFELKDDTARHGLCDLAEQRNADLIVIGSHGRRGLRRALLGSTAEAVVRHAPCSVLVVR